MSFREKTNRKSSLVTYLESSLTRYCLKAGCQLVWYQANSALDSQGDYRLISLLVHWPGKNGCITSHAYGFNQALPVIGDERTLYMTLAHFQLPRKTIVGLIHYDLEQSFRLQYRGSSPSP